MAGLTLGWLQLVALLGAVQGAFLAVVLAARRTNRTANRLLAVAMLAFSVHLATVVYHAVGIERIGAHFFGLAYPLPFLYGPLVYLYAVTAADRDRGLRPRDALHLVPFLAVVLAGLPIYLSGAAAKVTLFEQLQRGARPAVIAIADPLKMVSGVAYAAVTVAFLRRHRERVKDSYSSTERVNLRWLLVLGGGAAATWGLAVVLQLLEAARLVRTGLGDDAVTLAIAALVYAIGWTGLRQMEIVRWETAEYPVPPRVPEPGAPAAGASPPDVPTVEAEAAAVAEAMAAADEPAPARYERSGLTDRQAQRLEAALLGVMERDQPWRDPELTLADLAARLGTTPHKLSEVLNARVGRTFYDFVNGYRVREVERRIAAGEARTTKILSLAMDAGFASKSTFNVVFKKHTNRTPSDYREAIGV